MEGPSSKKVKRIFKNPNPLFVRWLTEWKSEAEQKDSKLKHTYAKCLRSLRQFPLPLQSGRSCAILKGFGPTVCNKLDQMLEKHKNSDVSVGSPTNSESRITTVSNESRISTASADSRNSAVSDESRNNNVINGNKNNTVSAVSRNSAANVESRNNTANSCSRIDSAPAESSSNIAGIISDSSTSSQRSRTKLSATRSKKVDSEASRAILHVLHTPASAAQLCLPRCRVLAAARELMSLSTINVASADQQLSRAFLLLQREKLVDKQPGRPVRYFLTPAGCSIAASNFTSDSSVQQQQQYNLSGSEHAINSERLVNDVTLYKTKNSCDEIGTGDYDITKASTSSMTSLSSVTSSMTCANVDSGDDCAIVVSSDSEIEELPEANVEATSKYRTNNSTIATNKEITKNTGDSTSNSVAVHKKLKQRHLSDFLPTNSNNNKPNNDTSREPAKSAVDGSKIGSVADLNRVSTVCRLEAGSFDIVLCVDTQETAGSSKSGTHASRRDRILTELSRCGIVTDVRRLSVGDFLWLARSRQHSGEELVLPWIVERKRLDDLASSIRGTRYKEQKFRLSRCGLPNVVYLAEGTVANVKHIGLPESSLNQALTNSQVIDNFLVQRTADQRATAQFLAALTRSLQTQFSDRDLYGCLRADLPPPDSSIYSTSSSSRSSPDTVLLTFAEFQRDSAKRQKVSVRDVWARGLICIAGVTDDKASAIVQQYATPQLLVDAYSSCGSVQEAEQLLAPLRGARSGRAVGAAISRVVYHWLCDEQLQ